MISFNDLVEGFKELGITAGDTLLVHSSYNSFGGVENGPQTVIDALTSILSENGTLIVPTFNWGFCRGEIFDVRNTPSECGILTEVVRKNPKSKRVLHPIYSFSVLGKLAEEIGQMQYKSSYGGDSVFAKLRELGGKIMIIGLPFNNSLTFVHHIEEMEGTDYRYLKEFRGNVIDESGREYVESFFMNVKTLDGTVETYVDDAENLLDKEKITKIRKIGESIVKVMKANDVYRRIATEMKINPHLLCKIYKKQD